jgi:hypothetical protein
VAAELRVAKPLDRDLAVGAFVMAVEDDGRCARADLALALNVARIDPPGLVVDGDWREDAASGRKIVCRIVVQPRCDARELLLDRRFPGTIGVGRDVPLE